MGYLIEDFIEATNAAQTPDEVFALYTKAIGQLGFDSAVYTFVNDHPLANQVAGHGVQTNFPDDWMQHYTEKGYGQIDPVTMRILQHAPVFTWDSMQTSLPQKNILLEAAEAGLRNGVGVGLFSTRGEIAGVGLACAHKDKLEPDRNLLSKVKLLTEQFHLAYCALTSLQHETHEKPILSARELEVLRWWAEGKSSGDIAMILNCTVANVKFHVTNIYRKLDANSKITAVTKAIRLGLILPVNPHRIS